MDVARQAEDGVAAQRARALIVIAAGAAVSVGVVYLVFVRTAWGQRLDDVAFDGRSVEDPEVTRALNDLLHSVTRVTLFLLTAAIVALGAARRRFRLAVAAGFAVSASVVTSELLKHVLDRPPLDDVAGIVQNSYPSGHATIGMALSLGLVMVAPHRQRWAATSIAALLAVTFGVGVLATGWHRPSDTIGAYLIAVMWFSAVTAALLWWRGAGSAEQRGLGAIERRLSPGAATVAGMCAVAALVAAVVATFQADGLRTVEYAADYLVVCAVIIAAAVVIVVGYSQLLRGVDLDAPSLR